MSTIGAHLSDFDLHQLTLEHSEIAGKEGEVVAASAAHHLGGVFGVSGFPQRFFNFLSLDFILSTSIC